MTVTEIGSLREIVRNKKIWEPASWREFLEKDLVPFYILAFNLKTFYDFLISDKINGKSLVDIKDTVLMDKIKAALIGGVKSDKSNEIPFAKFMYDMFGLQVNDAQSFEKSVELYKGYPAIRVNQKAWINKVRIDWLVNNLWELIDTLCKSLNIKLSDLGIQDVHPTSSKKIIEPDSLLPLPGEKPDKLQELIRNFKRKAMELSIGVNPFTTFTFFVRAIPLIALMKYLECTYDEVIKLANFLGLRAYSMVDLSEIKLPTNALSQVILVSYGYVNEFVYTASGIMPLRELSKHISSLSERILRLQDYLNAIDERIEQRYNNLIEQATNNIKVNFEPWEKYESIFSVFYKSPEVVFDLEIEEGMISKINHLQIERNKRVMLMDFLIRCFPAISGGIIRWISITIKPREQPQFTIAFYRQIGKKWIEKLIANRGKT